LHRFWIYDDSRGQFGDFAHSPVYPEVHQSSGTAFKNILCEIETVEHEKDAATGSVLVF
jgi:hypothetical protein